MLIRADFRFALSQWETVLLCNDVSHWLGASLVTESALHIKSPSCFLKYIRPMLPRCRLCRHFWHRILLLAQPHVPPVTEIFIWKSLPVTTTNDDKIFHHYNSCVAKTYSCHVTNFVAIGGIGGCRCGNVRCRMCRQIWHFDDCRFPVIRDHFVLAPSEWETTFHCNIGSHWLVAYAKWSLEHPYQHIMNSF